MIVLFLYCLVGMFALELSSNFGCNDWLESNREVSVCVCVCARVCVCVFWFENNGGICVSEHVMSV